MLSLDELTWPPSGRSWLWLQRCFRQRANLFAGQGRARYGIAPLGDVVTREFYVDSSGTLEALRR